MFGVCYTQSGGVKKYEPEQLVNVPGSNTYITCYTVGYPSTAYYPDSFGFYFNVKFYPDKWGPPVPNYEPGMVNYAAIGTRPNDNTYNKIYDLMSYTPPYGYVLDENGIYTYTAQARLYTYNYDVQYGNVIKPWFSSMYIEKKFKYKKKDSKVYVRLTVSHDIIINGNTYHPYGGDPAINTINLESGDGCVTNILVGLDSNHYTGAFDVSFDGASPSNIKTYLLVNNQYYDVTNSTSSESKRCYISKYKDRFHIVGWMYTTGGFDYTFNSSDWENNSLFTQEGTKDSFGGYIPDKHTAKFVVKFTLSNGYSRKDCQLIVDVTTNK